MDRNDAPGRNAVRLPAAHIVTARTLAPTCVISRGEVRIDRASGAHGALLATVLYALQEPVGLVSSGLSCAIERVEFRLGGRPMLMLPNRSYMVYQTKITRMARRSKGLGGLSAVVDRSAGVDAAEAARAFSGCGRIRDLVRREPLLPSPVLTIPILIRTQLRRGT